MIKARPVAGDRAVGADFLGDLTPYIWRKHLDFAAIHDIHSIKRQIDAHRGGGTVKVLGPQHQARPRRHPRDRVLRPDPAADLGRPQSRAARCARPARPCARSPPPATSRRSAADELIEAYGFLRRVEHRLQMVDDRQTHSLPDDEAGVAAIATFLGYRRLGSPSRSDLLDRLRCVEGHYAELFEEAPSLAGPGGNLVFTGTDDDPGTLADLAHARLPRSVGRPPAWCARWHHGRYRATRTARARELLTELMPGAAARRWARPPRPTRRCCASTTSSATCRPACSSSRCSSPTRRCSSWSPTIMGSAPGWPSTWRAAPSCSMRCCRPPSPCRCRRSTEMRAELAPAAGQRRATSRTCSTWRGAGPTTGASRSACSSSRRSCAPRRRASPIPTSPPPRISALCDRVEQSSPNSTAAFAASGSRCSGMGKLGSREMTATSDLDLIFVYDIPPDLEALGRPPAAGADPVLHAAQRQDLTRSPRTPTKARFYEVDMRLRPSGRAGPLANSLEGFESYQRNRPGPGSTWR